MMATWYSLIATVIIVVLWLDFRRRRDADDIDGSAAAGALAPAGDSPPSRFANISVRQLTTAGLLPQCEPADPIRMGN